MPIDFASELAKAEAAFRPVRGEPSGPVHIPPLSDFSPEVQLDVDALEIDQAAFLEALEAFAAEDRGDGMTWLGEHLNEEFIPPGSMMDGSDAEYVAVVNAQARVAWALSPEFRNHFAHAWFRTVCSRLGAVEREEMVDDSEREPEECGQFWSPEVRP